MVFRAALLATAIASAAMASDEEITLFNSKGKAVAYVAIDRDMTIYLWGGKPVAYLEPDKARAGFHIYGFNGKHLGWLVQGVASDHDGDAACAVKEKLNSTEIEPFKMLKELRPLKSLKELAPLRPLFSRSFGSTGCSLFLAEGAD